MKTLIAYCNMRCVGRSTEMNLYHLLRKAEDGLGSDTVPMQHGECTPVEIPSWVAEAGSSDVHPLAIHVTVEQAHTVYGWVVDCSHHPSILHRILHPQYILQIIISIVMQKKD